MNANTQAIFQAALGLPEAERALLANRLLESLSAEQELVDKDFTDELDRRFAEYQQDPTVAIPWSAVRRKK